MQPDQIVVVLDIDGALSDDDLSAALPSERNQRVFIRATARGAVRIDRTGGVRATIDWDGLAQVTSRIAEEVRNQRSQGERQQHLFIAGLAPLPVFFHLGFELSRWLTATTFLNLRSGAWEKFDLSQPDEGTKFFDTVGADGEPRESSGRVALFVTTGHTAAPDVIRQAVTSTGDAFAGAITLRAPPPGFLTSENFGAAAADLVAAFTGVRKPYPHLDGLAVFLSGPAPLAFLAGRSVNQTITRDVWVTNFDDGGYRVVLTLPWRAAGVPPVEGTAEANADREHIRVAAETAIVELRTSLIAEDLFDPIVPAPQWLERFREIEFDNVALTDEFSLSIAKLRMSFGRGLLDCMRKLEESRRADLARLLALHEIFHFDQLLLSTNYVDIGRAGLALEEVDYFADCFALMTEIRRQVRLGGNARDVAVAVLDSQLGALEVFDRAQHGASIRDLPERRLRRYLIWHLQRERVATARTLKDVEAVFTGRVVVELAHVESFLDGRGERIVRAAKANAELVVVVNRQLRRFSQTHAFNPLVLVDAARAFDAAALRRQLEHVVEQEAALMTPWVR